jgi:hypothetical protein
VTVVQTAPRVLFVYYTFSQQTHAVVEAMAKVLRERGCDVALAKIEFTEPRYQERFTTFPFRHVYLDLFGMLPAQVRKATGHFRLPPELMKDDYDFVCIGSPTWWLTTSMPIRSFLKSEFAAKLLMGKRFSAFVVCRRYWGFNLKTVREIGTQQGGHFVSGTHFVHAGGQIMSMLSLLSFLGKGVDRPRYLGIRIPPASLKPDYLAQSKRFASDIADRLGAALAGTSHEQVM